MVELIFVIVILGILAAVAVPKLAATRDDARLAGTATSIASAGTELASFAVATGTIERDLSKASGTIAMLVAERRARTNTDEASVYIAMGQEPDCVKLQVMDGVDDANLTIDYPNPSLDELCFQLQDLINPNDYPLPLRGKTLEY
jgi:competence protein ComGC